MSVLHVERVAPDRLLAGSADETGHMPGLFQGIHDVLQREHKTNNEEQLVEVNTTHSEYDQRFFIYIYI